MNLSKRIVAAYPLPFIRNGVKGSQVIVRRGDGAEYVFGFYKEGEPVEKDLGPAHVFASGEEYREKLPELISDLKARYDGVA